MTTVTKEFTIENTYGLHTRPSASFVKKANEFQSQIKVVNEKGYVANGKSVIGLMCLTAVKGTKVKVIAEGHDANEAIYAITNLFENKFGEN